MLTKLKTSKWTHTLLAAALALSLLSGGLAFAWPPGGKGGGNGGGGGKPPKNPPPPVAYQLTYLGTLGGDESYAEDMNDAGVAVGASTDSQGAWRAFVYEQAIGMVDLNSLADLPDGWTATSARGINNWGEIVGRAGGPNEESRAFVFSPIVDPPQFILLPRLSVPAPPDACCGERATSINDLGDVAGYFIDANGDPRSFVVASDGTTTLGEFGDIVRINNLGQVVTSGGYRFTPGLGWEFFDGLTPRGINDAGSFVGQNWGGKKRSAFRYSDARGLEALQTSHQSPWGEGINSDEDVVFRGNGSRVFVYTDEHGVLALDDLVVGSVADLDDWFSSYSVSGRTITDRDATGFGSICGFGRFGSYVDTTLQAFVLTPMVP